MNTATIDVRRDTYMKRFGLKWEYAHHHLPVTLLDQLDRCLDDESRRIILGISHKDSNAPKPERFRGKLMSIATR